MRGAAAAKSAFNDPTKGGAVPQGREAAPSVVFSQCKDEKFHPSSRPSGYKQWFRRLRASFRPSVLKPPASPGAPAITPESLEGADVLVFGAPREKFTVEEFDALKDFIHDGGGVLILAHEGGEEALGTNLNYLIEEYGMSVNADALVRTAHQTYFHPKEALVTDGVLNRAVTQYAERGGERARRNKKGSDGSRGDPLNDSTNDDDPASSASPSGGGTPFAGSSGGEENRPVAFVMPHAATLNVQKHLDSFNLESQFGTYSKIHALSGGQKVKVVLAAAMWMEPHVLILDEPTNFLDRDSLGALATAIKNYAGGCIIISHQREFYSALCPEVWSVVDGRCTVSGSEWMDAAEKARKKAEKEAAKTASITKEDKFDAFGNKIEEKQAAKKCPNSVLKKIKKQVAAARKAGKEVWTDEEIEKEGYEVPM